MNCKKCGQALAADTKFCPTCGTRVEQQQSNAFCSTCGAKLDSSAVFCPVCGVKVGQAKGRGENNTVTTSGKLLASLNLTSKYEGTPNIGIAKATGTLSVYDDRIEFRKQIGNPLTRSFGSAALKGAFGTEGMVIAMRKVRKVTKDPVDIYPVSQIAQLRVGKYMSIYNTLVVLLRDGTTVSFCPAVPGSTKPQDIINSLQPYLR